MFFCSIECNKLDLKFKTLIPSDVVPSGNNITSSPFDKWSIISDLLFFKKLKFRLMKIVFPILDKNPAIGQFDPPVASP